MVLFLMYFFCVLWFNWSNYGGCIQVVSFFKYRQCIITAPVVPTVCLRVWRKYAVTRSVHQPLAYAPSALLKHWLIRGEAHQYIDPVVYINTEDSHHRLNEHIILYVFRAPRHDSIPLNWYRQIYFIIKYYFFKFKFNINV